MTATAEPFLLVLHATSVDALEALWNEHSEDPDLRAAILLNALTPGWVLERIYPGDDSVMRTRLAQHPNLPEHLLVALSEDSDSRVRLATLSNPATTDEVLRLAARGGLDAVSAQVASNPRTPADLVIELASSPSPLVAARASRNTALPVVVLVDLYRRGMVADHVLGERQDLDPDLLADLCRGATTPAALSALAQNPTVPDSLIGPAHHRWARDMGVANLPTPPGLRARLCARLGVDEENTTALASLVPQRWWEMDGSSEAVELALIISPNP